MPEVNLIAVLVAAIVAMAVGGLWYSPLLFGKRWIKLMKFTEKQVKAMQEGSKVSYLYGFLNQLVMAYVMGAFFVMLGVESVQMGMRVAFWLWLGFVGTTSMGSVLWEGKTMKLFALNAGYQIVAALLMASVLVSVG